MDGEKEHDGSKNASGGGGTVMDPILRHYDEAHSEWQLRHGIVGMNSYGTTYGKLRQALRELYSRDTAIAQIDDDLDMARIDLDGYRRWRWLPFGRRRRAVKIRAKSRWIADRERRRAEIARERDIIHDECRTHLEDVGDMSPEARKRLDENMWLNAWRQKLAGDLISHGRISPATVVELIGLPANIRHEILATNGSRELREQLLMDFDLLPPSHRLEDRRNGHAILGT